MKFRLTKYLIREETHDKKSQDLHTKEHDSTTELPVTPVHESSSFH